ncbi:MAG: tetratricopeptide repeat protein [candidate division NC10 bacterium]|nr:tetratricopeptide repeat protein [candidate division NC10 bacterium]MDE2322662.1 tetratricopeptide repeat protein [candidate division NC10 bacterium]
MRLSEELYLQAQTLIAGRLGLDFSRGRQADLERGLVQACHTSSVSAPETYLAWLATLPDESAEWRRLASHLTVGETYFFRDGALFEALEQHVLPSLITGRRTERNRRLRLWSAGCATGEEPYSLAILLDRLLPDLADWALTILATDINPDALETARRGRYREWSFRETPQWIRDRYFHRLSAETFEVDPRIRRMVTFAPLNLAKDGYPGVVTNTSAVDLILCRNVLMYFTREAQQAATVLLERALVRGGWLAVSPAEASVELYHPLVTVTFRAAILYRKGEEFAANLPLSDFNSAPEVDSGWRVADSPMQEPRHMEQADPLILSETKLTEAPPETPSDLQRAQALADQGKLEAARELCEAALVQDRLDPGAHLLLAAVCHERGEIPLALEALRRAIYLAPDSAAAHFLLGSLLLRQGQRKRGRRSMETVVSLLNSVPREEAVAGGDGLTAGRLLETARAYLEMPS